MQDKKRKYEKEFKYTLRKQDANEKQLSQHRAALGPMVGQLQKRVFVRETYLLTLRNLKNRKRRNQHERFILPS